MTTLTNRFFAAIAAVATTFTLMIVSFTPPAANLAGVIA